MFTEILLVWKYENMPVYECHHFDKTHLSKQLRKVMCDCYVLLIENFLLIVL